MNDFERVSRLGAIYALCNTDNRHVDYNQIRYYIEDIPDTAEIERRIRNEDRQGISLWADKELAIYGARLMWAEGCDYD